MKRLKDLIRANSTPAVLAKIMQYPSSRRPSTGSKSNSRSRRSYTGRNVKNKDALANRAGLGYFRNLPELQQ
ncbi:MAG: hypothetical protein HY900_31535 [Deltaproteobacteria bacterium]|nr:hypothetical protein [Deltaproteobacteria bacterium]